MASAPPRPIEGCIGDRVRVIFGDTGSEWLLLLNHDDGNRKWQSRDWSPKNGSPIPYGLTKQMTNCQSKGRYCDAVDFGGKDGRSWYVHGVKRGDTAGHYWSSGLENNQSMAIKRASQSAATSNKVAIGERNGRNSLCLIQGRNDSLCFNVDDGLSKRLERIKSRNKAVHLVRLFHGGSYFIRDEEGKQWQGSLVVGDCSDALRESGTIVKDLAVAKNGAWLIVKPGGYTGSTGIDRALQNALDKFYNEQNTWKRNRQNEIRAYHDRIRADREAARLERERQAREEQERRDREAAEVLARRELEEETSRQQAEQTAGSSLESKLEQQLTAEERSIAEMEKHLETMKEHLQSRKRSLRDSLDHLYPKKRQNFQCNDDSREEKKEQEKNICVICHDAETARACVPCGHFCLCDECGPTLASTPDVGARLCPLCREPLQSTLKIFGLNSS